MFVSYRHKLVGTQRIVAIVVKMCLDQQAKQTLKTLCMVIKHGPLQQAAGHIVWWGRDLEYSHL